MVKIIAVIGATGAQGGGLIRAILADKSGEWKVRALTRNPDSDKAKALAAAGAEVVKTDIDDEKSLTEAFTGAYGAFCVTAFWEHFSGEKELAQAANMAKAAQAAKVEHVIWSTLEDTRKQLPLSDASSPVPVLQGKYKVPHFDAKGQANKLFLQHCPTTFLYAAFYWDNFIYFGMGPQKNPEGKLVLNMPLGGDDALLPGIWSKDIGLCAFGIFKGGKGLLYTHVGVAGEQLTGKQMAASLTEALGQEVTFNNVPFDVYRKLGFPGCEDLGNMFHHHYLFNDMVCDVRSVHFSRNVNPELSSFKDFLAANKDKIPIK